jgi:2-polyprenyl-3-methyl-5-hydroxy-6-metoxy-1,4-benzoquinol methylase
MTLMRALDRDRWHPRLRRAWHPFEFHRHWFRELAAYYRHLSRDEFWANYRELRAEAAALWASGTPAAEVYAKTDWFIYRQAYYRRDRCWHAVETLLGPTGRLLEYGAGIAPVTAWLAHRRPALVATVADLSCRTLDFAHWRFRGVPSVRVRTLAELSTAFTCDVIVCTEVLEHLRWPRTTLERFHDTLTPGGFLYGNFVATPPDAGNLATPQARDTALAYLHGEAWRCLVPMTAEGGDGIYQRC